MSDRIPFILVLDSILGYELVYEIHVNKFVSICELMRSRKDTVNSKDITEIFLFSLFESSVMPQLCQ